MTISKKILAGALVVLVSGCASYDLQGAKSMSATGSAFTQELFKGYLDLAIGEDEEGDWDDAAFFTAKAKKAGMGEEVAPQDMAERSLTDDGKKRASEMLSALRGAMGKKDSNPAAVAGMQVAYDCYLQEKEENDQPEHIAKCEDAFKAAQAKVMGAPMMGEKTFIVFFDFDSAELTDAAQDTIKAVSAMTKKDGSKVNLAGHTDTSGADSYNVDLSKRRATAVSEAMQALGVASGNISTEYFGESAPAKQTGDGVRAPENRRVNIIIK